MQLIIWRERSTNDKMIQVAVEKNALSRENNPDKLFISADK